ncbi:hypothetical protein KW794_02065 [Candidatus Saccharibacteria bacterium]|nr:hypothetical protein [Candidatus Saccharibacteria bacterium]
MSNTENSSREAGQYDYYGQKFYEAYSNSRVVMEKVNRANDLINTYLYAFGVDSLYDLPSGIQHYLFEQARIEVTPEELYE